MEEHPTDLESRFCGALLGAAVADALALPYRHYSRAFLRSMVHSLTEEFALPHTGFHPQGQYGAGTQALLAAAASILEAGEVSGDSLTSHLTALWKENILVERDPSTSEVLRRAGGGCSSWRECALEVGKADAAPLPRAVAVALWDHQDPGKLREDAEVSARVTHRDPRVIACAAGTAAAVATAVVTTELHLGVFLDNVAAAIGAQEPALHEIVLDFPRVLSVNEHRAMRRFEAVCLDDSYPPSSDGLSDYCIPAFCTAVYSFLRSPYGYEKAVDSCLRSGGQMHVAAMLAGAMCGALLGVSGIPSRLAESLLDSERISGLARELHRAWAGSRRTSEACSKPEEPPA